MKKVIVLTGAGISAESGLKTFRDADGLWEGHDVMEVASPEGWNKNPALVLDFYNQRRKQLLEVIPNQGHLSLVELEKKYNTKIITQNVDDLHERAGSTQIIHLHGELTKAKSIRPDSKVITMKKNIHVGDLADDGYQLRPHIVWFGEAVPEIERAAMEISNADFIIIIGTSMQVYPAAGLVGLAPANTPIYYIDPNPTYSYELNQSSNLRVIAKKATEGVPMIVDLLMKM